VLMLIAIAGAAFGWINYRRAHEADVAAQQARSDAEQLVGFLIEDFYAELEPTGRVETMGKLAQKAVDYYDRLPPALLTTQTQIYRGMALIRLAGVALARDDLKTGNRSLDEARKLFENLHAEGHRSEQVALGLALVHFTPFAVYGPSGGPVSQPGDLKLAADVLRPIAAATDSSPQARLVYADVLNHLSHQEPLEKAVTTCDEARRVLAALGALDLSNLTATSVYADTADSQARHLLALGRLDEAAVLEQEVYDLAEKALARRPGDFRSMRNRALAADLLGVLADRRHDHAASERHAANAEQAGENYVRFNPLDMAAWSYWIRGKGQLATAYFEQGRIAESIGMLRSAVALEKDSRVPSSLGAQLNFVWARLAGLEVRMGEPAAQASLRAASDAHAQALAQMPEGSARRALLENSPAMWRGRAQLWLGNDVAALESSLATLAGVRSIEVPADDLRAGEVRDNLLRFALATATTAAIGLGRYGEAEALARDRLGVPPNQTGDADPQDEKSRATVALAHAVAMQGRGVEALELLQPVLDGYRAEQKAGAAGTTFQRDLAYALYVVAISQPADPAGRAKRNASLLDAGRALGAMTAEARRLSDNQQLANWINAARAGS